MSTNVLFRFRPSRSPVARLSVASTMIAILASLAGAGPSLGASFLENGSFENGSYYGGPGGWQVVGVGDSSLPGWAVTQGSVDWVSGYWQPADGSMSIDLNGNGPGTIHQTFSTIPNTTYKVTFSLSGNPESGRPPRKTMTMDVAGTTRGYTYDTSIHGNSFSDMEYGTKSYSFVAQPNTDSTTLTFTSTTSGDAGVVLDDVVVTQATPVIYNARKDFKLSPNQTNPSGAWSYRQTDSDGSRRLLTHFDASFADVEGIEAWSDEQAYLAWPWVPSVAYNNTGADYLYLPADRLFVHPSTEHAIVLRWKSPSAGHIAINLTVTDVDAGGGNGVVWSIGKLHRQPAASGTLENGATADAYVAYMNVKAGDPIDLRVGARGDEGWDTTQVGLKISFWPD